MVNIKIKGDTWKCSVYDDEEFLHKFGDGMAAFCQVDSKQIIFNEDDLTLQTVIHEVAHAYISYLHLIDSAELKVDQIEEIYCEMFAHDGPDILKISKRLFKSLKQRM